MRSSFALLALGCGDAGVEEHARQRNGGARRIDRAAARRAGVSSGRRAAAGAAHLTGVRKKRTDDTMTMTRLTQLPTECVTGETRCRIM